MEVQSTNALPSLLLLSFSSTGAPKNLRCLFTFIVTYNQKYHGIKITINCKPTNVGRIALKRQARRKTVDPDGIPTTDLPIHNQMHWPLGYHAIVFDMLQPTSYEQQALLRSENNRDHSKMKNESVKKSLEKSKNVLEEKRKMVQQKIFVKTNTFTIIAMNFVQEQLNANRGLNKGTLLRTRGRGLY